MGLFRTLTEIKSAEPPATSSRSKRRIRHHSDKPDTDYHDDKDLPAWSAAPEASYVYGKYNEALEDEFEAAEAFCRSHPVDPPRLLPSHTVEVIKKLGCSAWGLEQPQSPRFIGQIYNHFINDPDAKGDPGTIKVVTAEQCQDVCILSNLPIIGGLYDVKGKTGVYYEVSVQKMDGIIAIGTACRPYPPWRLPGWNRMSAGFHLDDMRKFFEDPDGGRDYTDAISSIKSGDTIGCGYEFGNGVLFYTYNGMRLPPAFTGAYLPRQNQDVFAAIGVEGRCDFGVNFGGDVFKWKEGNEWAWRVEGQVGTMSSGSGMDDELPAYQEL